MTPEAQVAISDAIKGSTGASNLVIQTPVSAAVASSRMTTEDMYTEGPWLALIVLAGIIIFFCIIGMIVICFTWARYDL